MRSAGIMTHNQIRSPNESVPLLAPGMEIIIVITRAITTVDGPKKKPMKNNQIDFGSSCCIIVKVMN